MEGKIIACFIEQKDKEIPVRSQYLFELLLFGPHHRRFPQSGERLGMGADQSPSPKSG